MKTAECFPPLYSELFDLIVNVIDEITELVPFDKIIANLEIIKTTITSDSQCSKELAYIQTSILEIIDNIKNRAPLTIVCNRIQYLQKIITQYNQGIFTVV